MNEFIRIVSIGVVACGSFAVLCLFVWAACEALLSVEERVCLIFKVQKPMLRYLRNAKLYDKLIDEHLKAAKGGTN